MSFLASKNGIAFVICSLIGFLAGYYLPAGAWTTFVSILVSYHLFLIWLVITAEHETGFSLPVSSTLLTHLACLALVVSFGIARNVIPFFWLIRYFIPAIAPFECKWLFSADPHKKKNKPAKALTPEAAAAAAEVAATAEAVTADDYQAWLHHVANQKSAPRKPGVTVKDEYHQFMLARAKSRAAASSK
jgi:hypothetical protein